MRVKTMLKTILTPALIALSLAGAANAAQTSTDTQLAGAAGVAAGQFTTAELQNIITARRENDANTVQFYLTHTNRTETTGDASGQLAKLAGVAQDKYSANELQCLITAKTNNDAQTIAFITSGADRNTTDNLSTVSAGKAQLAGALGLNPADYSVAQLVILDAQNTSGH
jgi:hypothetical protein